MSWHPLCILIGLGFLLMKWTYLKESRNDFSYVVPPVLLRDMLLDELSAIFAKNSASILDHRLPLKSACHDAPLQTDMLSNVLWVENPFAIACHLVLPVSPVLSTCFLFTAYRMSNTKISLLSEIHDKEMTWNAKVVVSRMWHYRGGSDNGPIVHTDVVVLDEEGTHMYGQIPPGPTENLKDILEEGKPGIEDYPYCTYILISFSDIPVRGPNTHRFLDVIGRITAVTDILVVHSQYKAEPSDTRTIVLEDQAGNEISLVLWGARAREFDAEEVRTASNAGAVIAIFVGTLPKMYRGVKGLSGSSACRWYIDEDLPEMNAFRARYFLFSWLGPVTAHIPGEQPMVATPVCEPPVEMNVKELLALDPFDNLKKQFMVKVVIQRLGSDHRWWFLSCRECHKTAYVSGRQYRCLDYTCPSIKADPSYCLCSFGSDGSAEAEFMFFDKATRSVTGKPLMTLIHHKYPGFTNVHDLAQIGGSDVGMPVEISCMVNQKYVLVVSISSKSFQPTSTQLSFQVNRIDQTFKPELAPLGFGGASHASAASYSTQNSGATVPILKPFATGSSTLTIVPLDETKKTAATDDAAEAITVTDETKQVGQETETASAEDDKDGLYDQSKTKRFILHFFESQQVFSRNSKTTVFDPFSSFAKLASSFYEHNLYPQARRIKLSSPVCEDEETSKNRAADLAIEYMETNEQKLAPTRVNVSKQLLLELAVTALKLTTSQSVHHEEDEDRFFAIIEIHVPPEINMPRLNTKLFAGDYCQTMEGAIESASLNALVYMQTENIVVIDDLNLPRLVRCRKELVQAKSWSDIFEHAIVRLKQKVVALEKEVQLLKAGSATTTKEPRQ
ncbi:hypothetical protein D1007_12279 [Hordeum vulgare]|nr:hypothetical protein D1007_12279 [Hordeum vulgare]